MGRLSPTGFHELLQRQAVGRQRTLHQLGGFTRREPVGLKGRRPRQFGLARTHVTHGYGRQAIAKGRVGQQRVAEPVGGLIQRFEALDDRGVPSTLVSVRNAPIPSPSTVQLTTRAR